MNHGDTEALRGEDITGQIIGSCIEIHRMLGPGLLESAYEDFNVSVLKNGLNRLAN